MKTHRFERALSLMIATVLAIVLPLTAAAEDIDIFVGGAGGSSAANVLIIIDNTSNWADNAQHWPDGDVQGQAEIKALIAVIPTLTDAVSVGLMLFNQNGSGSCCSGGYIRYAMQKMDAAHRAALVAELQKLLDDFSDPANKAASNASYSMALFDAFKYFGGYTSPAHATDDVAGTPQTATAFGTRVFATPASTFNRPDAPGYTDLTDTVYLPPAAAADACGGKNYIIFVGNGFPNTDTAPSENLKTFLEGVGGNSAQIPLPVLTTKTSTTYTVPSVFGSSAACYNDNSAGLSSCNTASASVCGAGYDSCTCGAPTSATGCSGSKVHYTILGGVTTTTVEPTNATALPTAINTRYADEWTRFLFMTDVNAAAGQQNVTTFTIDAFNAKQNADQTALLYSMATSGGGQYYAAKNKNDLIVKFGNIFAKIQATNNTFVSASLPVNATSRSVNNNEVYIGMFRPDGSARPLWYGNVKQYKIGSFTGDYNLADASGAQAVSPLTGFFDDCATSTWTSDSGKYWWAVIGNPPPAGACPASTKNTFDKFSDAPDGPKVEKGSVAEIIRRGNNPGATSTWALNRTMYTKSFVPFTVANTGMTTEDVDFIKGTNVDPTGNYLTYQFDPTDTSKTTTIRPTVHGDVVHSRPLPINYPSQTVVYYGANDGSLHAVDGLNGQELWAYVAPEFYSTLPRLRQNSPLISYSFLDPMAMSPPPLPKNYYFDGSIGAYQSVDNTRVWIYPTMRRGGRMLYALDVSNPSVPSLKWTFGCPNLTDDVGCVGTGADSIGQTWSTPTVASLKVGGTVGETPTTLVVVGGGYDSCEDGAPSATCSGAKGSIVYILNADTGAKLASFTTRGRVVADVAFVDLDGDGIPDLAYAVDTRGSIYRISFGLSKSAPLAAAAWTATRVAATTGSDRKFLYAPAVMSVADNTTGNYYVYLALGSGDREQPLETQYPYANPVVNRFYVFLDNLAATPPADTSALDNLDSTSMSDFTDVSTNSCSASTIVPSSSKSGWFMDLNAYGRGEQTVTSAAIVGGAVFFSTNHAIPRSANSCAPLGEARGYAVNLFNASGVIGVQPANCGGARSGKFVGGGLPPSPVVANVRVGNKVVSICIGCVNTRNPSPDSVAVDAHEAFSLPPQKRKRAYWRQEGDN